ncbi:MAG TPA: antibiotic biosynthesis monooxygenase [Pseudonocardia sp.]
MYARITVLSDGADLDRWRQIVAEQIAPSAADKPGFVRAVWLLDEEAGTGMSVTLWDSREALDAAEAGASGNRDKLAAAVGGAMSVLRAEVVAEA